MKALLSLAAAAALCTLPAHAEPYTLFIYESDAQLALRSGSDAATIAYWDAYKVFGEELAAAGVLRGGSAVTTGAPVVQVSAGAVRPAAAPYARSPLSLGGYFQIDVATDEDAIAWALKMPAGDGVVEVRAGYAVPSMAM